MFNIPAAPLEKLHANLEQKASGANAPKIHYRTLDTPIGTLLLIATETGLLRIAFENENQEAVLENIAQQISPSILRMPQQFDDTARWIDNYLAGDRTTYPGHLDRQLMRGYRREVLTQLGHVTYGERISYAHLAEQTSSPRAFRAVGSACATNPLPLVIPCHRVVKSDGTLGAYRGGPAVKEQLLELEITGHLPA